MNLSAIQKHLCIQGIYKRGQPYFDIPRLNSIERGESLKRRRPFESRRTVQSRFNSSFHSSQTDLECRVQREIDNFKKSETESTVSGKRTVNMEKMLARDSGHKSVSQNESQFHNFFIVHYNRSLDFQKVVGRGRYTNAAKGVQNEEQRDMEKVGKCYESLVFDRAAMRCLAHLHEQKERKVERDERVQPNIQRLERADWMTRVTHPGQGEFYEGKGRTKPSQLDNRLLKHNEYYWTGEDPSGKRDFLVVKRREDLRQRRIHEILGRKKIGDVREEMCDVLYFLRNKG